MERFQTFTRVVATGAPAPLAQVAVFLAGTLTPAATYSDTLPLPTVVSNPLTSAAITGLVGFYALNGRYDIVVTPVSGTPYTLADVLLFDPAD